MRCPRRFYSADVHPQASEADLLEWSGEIGSDISVFFSTGAAYCLGRGEIVRNQQPPLSLARAA